MGLDMVPATGHFHLSKAWEFKTSSGFDFVSGSFTSCVFFLLFAETTQIYETLHGLLET